MLLSLYIQGRGVLHHALQSAFSNRLWTGRFSLLETCFQFDSDFSLSYNLGEFLTVIVKF